MYPVIAYKCFSRRLSKFTYIVEKLNSLNRGLRIKKS